MAQINYRQAAEEPGTSVAVGTASTPVVAGDHDRAELVLTNDSDTIIYVRMAADGAVAGQGIRLNANGGSYSTDKYGGAVCAICPAGTVGTKNLTVMEI